MSSTRARLLGALLLASALPFAAPVLAQGQNKIVYDVFDWQIYQSTHFQIYYYSREKDALQKVVSMAESAYDELSRRLNYQIPKPIPLIYYATHAEFEQNNIITSFIPEAVGAFAEPAKNRMVLPIDVDDEKLQQLVQHELTHVFEYEILYGGRLSRALASSAPTWFMEGLASYLGNDEDDKDRMFIRDAVNSDQIPPITKVQIEGYVAYRYGHAVFDFMEAEWGKDSVRDFIFEFRSFLGRDVGVAIRRTFDIDPDEFDLRFRRYLRKKYLPLLAVKGEVSEYGERFRVGQYYNPSFEVGAAPSPSGDFVATMTTVADDVDIALLSVKDRKLYKNLSPGRTTKYEYLVAQYLTAGPESGRDLSFAPDGDRIAAFVRHERGRKLAIFSARGGGILERIPVAADVPLSPSWSPDGKSIVFSGVAGTSRDIFLLDLKSRTQTNLTSDAAFDASPVFSKDGKYVYHEKSVGGLKKIVRFPLDDPSKIEQVTWGEGNDEDPAFSPDGKRLYYSSSRGGIYNVYGQDLATGEILQYTDVIGAALGPAAFTGPDNQEKIVFSGFQAGRFQLYIADAKKPAKKLDEKALPPAPLQPSAVAGFVPAVEVSIDPEKNSRPKKFKLFLENAGGILGVNSDQTFVSQVRLDFTDYLGDKRAIFVFDSVSTFSNFRLGYFNLKHRLQWGIQAYDVRTFFLAQDTSTGFIVRDRRILKETGLSVDGYYPTSRYTRIEGNVGFISRTLDVPFYVSNAVGNQFQVVDARSDNDPTVGIGFSYDATRYKYFGPHGGRSLTLHYQYTPDIKDGGTLTRDLFGEARLYVPISRRTLFAFRAFGAMSDGNFPTVYYFGGLDSLRGFDFRSQIGNRVFYINTEFRFPLVDVIATPILAFQGIRGHIFLDVGGAWLKDQPFQFWDGSNTRLKDGLSSFGAGFSVYFLGLPWNVDFAKQWDLHHTLSSTQVTFFVGESF
jgi:hypothetical protein